MIIFLPWLGCASMRARARYYLLNSRFDTVALVDGWCTISSGGSMIATTGQRRGCCCSLPCNGAVLTQTQKKMNKINQRGKAFTLFVVHLDPTPRHDAVHQLNLIETKMLSSALCVRRVHVPDQGRRWRPAGIGSPYIFIINLL